MSCKAFKISISKELSKADPQVLLKETFKLIFGDSSCLVDVLEAYVTLRR